jgi:hypothetical protein
MHERDGSRRALDIEDDGTDSTVAERRRHRRVGGTGKYAGPKHIGWKRASTPLRV